ncbi:hypothetical protein [Marisediminicola senii]|nr:hypothetical protein [Marisediminicola senii]
MFRLLRFLPIVLPLARRALRSPQGKAAIAKVKSRLAGGGSTPR